jgi:hypothetical protein
MNKRNVFIGCFIFLIFQFSCNSDKSERKLKYKFLDGSGYAVFQYYLNNGDTIIDGPYSVYDKKNILKKTGTYINNEIYGITKFYYNNGNVESIHFIENSKDIGEISWYYSNGNIEKYSFYDDLGNLNFFANYNKKGEIEKWEGRILLEVYQYKLKEQNIENTYKLGEKIRYQFMFPNIPNTERKFRFELLDFDNSKIRRRTKKIEPVTLDVEEITVKKGKNTIRAYIEYKFKDERQIILSDTISLDFYVE